MKQHAADRVRRVLPGLAGTPPAERSRAASLLLRGRVPRSRTGRLPLDTVKRVVDEAAGGIERVDMFNDGEPFL